MLMQGGRLEGIDMLKADRRVFETKYLEADAFLRAARLRSELYGLLVAKAHSHSIPREYAMRRIAELMKAPACKETWFVEMLQRELLPKGDSDG